MLEKIISSLLKDGLKEKLFTNAALSVINRDTVLYIGCPESSLSLYFDIASITKPISGVLTIILYLEKRLDIETPISYWYGDRFSDIKIINLLNHSSGFKAYYPFYRGFLPEDSGKRDVKDKIIREILTLRGKSKETIYSDLNYILLCDIIEKSLGQEYPEIFRRFFNQRFSLEKLFFKPKVTPFYKKERFVPTGYSIWRKRELIGEVNDDNCFLLGEYSAHAGLFTDIYTLSRFVQMIIKGEISIPEQFLSPLSKGRFTFSGWDTPTFPNSTSGDYFTQGYTIGHLGFTGCSIWIDLKRALSIILLTNKTIYNVSKEKFNNFRKRLHNCLMERLVSV